MEIDQNVCKANDLIQKANYNLSATEQKLILFIISKIKPSDKKFQTYDFPMTEMIDVLGIDRGGDHRELLIAAMRRLRSKTLNIQTEKKDIVCGWLDSAQISRGKNQVVTIRVNEELRPYLLDLSERFTLYQLRNIVAMKGKYSIRLYELAKSHAYKNGFVIGVDDFQRMLHCQGYEWRDLKKRVLQPAVSEINLLSDLMIGYTPIRTGHAYKDLKFTINKKDTIESMTAQVRQEQILYGI